MSKEAHSFTWISNVPVLNQFPNQVGMAVVVAAGLMVFTAIARLQLARAVQETGSGVIPESMMSIRNFFEIVAESLYKLCVSVMGEHDAHTFFPFVGTIFLFVFASNLVGLIPGVIPSTDDLNTTLALGVFTFIMYNVAGVRANGLAYFKHFLGPVIWLAPLMVVIEIASHLFRPLSLGIRLRGNIMADHTVLAAFSSLVPYGVPIIFYGLGAFVCFMQAFVFCMMTMVYISLSTAHDH